MTIEKDLKTKLRTLRKLKKDTQNFTEERRQINGQIREIKKQLSQREESLKPDEGKQKLIDEIKRIYELRRKPLIVDLRDYDSSQLQNHLNRLKHEE